ncbi:MAG: ribosome-binding factor A [Chitinophagaceae bacterium]|nr:MAG: ribosome-binding factor A [Bacteroidetes bacterium OLB11]MCC6447358.1 ribosome-binding factor A [Chitinophagaceae bacterium]HMN31791.1 ribosome-binding factor A [Chitinophagaceae bacterium]
MEESKRQRQVAQVIQGEMSDIFRRAGLNVIHNGMISISKVKVTPDLLEARIYLSFFQIPDSEKMLNTIKNRDWELRKELAARIKNQVRKIPVLHYYLDDTLDYVFKMEEIFKTIHIPDNPDEQEGN